MSEQNPNPGAPQAPTAPTYGPPAVQGPVPGKTMGIVGLILAFLLPLVGLILSIIAVVQSKKAGVKNTPGVIGIIVGALFTVLALVFIIVVFAAFGGVAGEVLEACSGGASTVVVDGVEYTCE